jgi:protein transport protein SEC24
VISSLLTQIPKLFAKIKNPEPALLHALNAALLALQSTGGKVVCALASLPTWGPGRLHMREDPKAHGTENERKLFAIEQPGWKKTAAKLAESGIGVDFFIAAPGGANMDVATIGEYYYPSAVCYLLLTILRSCCNSFWW